MGEMAVPVDALYGATTQRAVLNFPISGQPLPRRFLQALGLIKRAAADTNAGLGLLDAAKAEAIGDAAQTVADGDHDARLPDRSIRRPMSAVARATTRPRSRQAAARRPKARSPMP